MRIAMFGFPLTGKTTLFRLLTGVEPPAHAVRGEVTVGVTKVPDPRLERLGEMYKPKKFTPAAIEYVDLAGVEKGEASKVLPLDRLRTADALAHVVRGFRDESLPHVEGDRDPARDVATMETELILADHTSAERRLEKVSALASKTGKDEDKAELALFEKVVRNLEQEIPLRCVAFDDRELERLRGYTFLSLKPLLIVVNADEEDAAKLDLGAEAFGLAEWKDRPATEIVALSAKIEQEISQLDPSDASSFREELGIREPALDRMIRASYRHLGRISFFTVGEDECRAWTVHRDTRARKAAGTIHSDLDKGFIRAEVIPCEQLLAAGSWAHARDKGHLRLEGQDYSVQDGEILHVRFNV